MATVPATVFNRNPSEVKRLAATGPVLITERDRPTLVVLSYAEYERLTGTPHDLSRWLEMDDNIHGDGEIDFDIEQSGLALEPVDDLADR